MAASRSTVGRWPNLYWSLPKVEAASRSPPSTLEYHSSFIILYPSVASPRSPPLVEVVSRSPPEAAAASRSPSTEASSSELPRDTKSTSERSPPLQSCGPILGPPKGRRPSDSPKSTS